MKYINKSVFKNTIISIILVFFIGTMFLNKTQPTNTQVTYNYLIKDYKGQVAVFDIKNLKKPIKEYNIYLNNLPQMDIDLIKNGVKKTTLNEVNLFIQDYM